MFLFTALECGRNTLDIVASYTISVVLIVPLFPRLAQMHLVPQLFKKNGVSAYYKMNAS